MSNKKAEIVIRGARVHNLKSINVNLPQNKLIVITGVSGSGKSSLAFDTIYAEGQRRYVESLSAYARQFMGRMSKPDADFISGIPPAIAIEQKVNSRNPRSTVGTSTEIYDYIRLLYARIGRTYSPITGKEVKRSSVDEVVKFISSLKKDSKVIVLSPAYLPDGIDSKSYFDFLNKQGFNRIRYSNGSLHRIDSENIKCLPQEGELFHIVVDRVITGGNTEELSRYADSVETAFLSSKGRCSIELPEINEMHYFSNNFEADGISFIEPSEHLFSFNNPLGACPVCEGYGKIIGIDEELVIPDQNLSVFEDAIACWKGESMKKWKVNLIMNASKFSFPIHKAWYKLTVGQKALVWSGNKYFFGLKHFFEYLEGKKYKIQYRVMLSRYRGKTQCPECRGTRLRKEAGYVRINKKAIWELSSMSVKHLLAFINNIKLNKTEEELAKRILLEIKTRVEFLNNVGLSYLSLNRLSSSLSGGESQRINIVTSLGSSLVGSLYILDEPSIGLHPRDTQLLIDVLTSLKQIGNTVLVVEHEEEIIRAADSLIDLGPEAGRLGGEIIFDDDIAKVSIGNSLTCKYLTGELKIAVPSQRRVRNSYVGIIGARENNLKEIDVKVPLNTITVVTGVSGSGKSSLIAAILYPALRNIIEGQTTKPGKFNKLTGDYQSLGGIELVDQNPIGKSSRSNPATYLKIYDDIRKLFSEQALSIQNRYKPSHFSFNVDGGRCEECRGEGTIKVEMQFMADVELECEVCNGKRFKQDILDVRYKNKNIHDILQMTINESIEFFSLEQKQNAKIIRKLRPLADVGLGYVKLGQSSSTLSGGESQRVKLAYFLSQESSDKHTLFIFDEPTTGLHFHDINKLLKSLNSLVEKGHSIVLIEHNLEMIKNADYIIDLGPEAGEEGGYLVFEGKPEELVKCSASITGKHLKNKLK